MIVQRENDDFGPLAWMRGVPVYATTVLVAVHVLFLVAVWSLGGLGYPNVSGPLVFSSAEVWGEGAIWQWFTYFLAKLQVHPLFFALEMLFLYLFGREVEKFIGRRKFLLMYAILVVTPPVLLTLLGLVFPTVLEGSENVHFAVFIAFATLYPGVEFFLRIQARWLALGFLALYGLFYLSARDWPRFVALMGDAGAACLYIHWVRGSLVLPDLSRFFRRRTPPREESPRPRSGSGLAAADRSPAKPVPDPDDPVAAIDPLLDKISRHGIASLTPQERAKLEKAREALLSRPKR